MTDFDGQAMDLFVEVVGMSPDERAARLQVVCGSVPGLRARVEQLLAHHEEAETIDFLRPPLPPFDFGASDHVPPDLPCRYQILMPQIDEHDVWPKRGGMGIVWRVWDRRFRRFLALKVMSGAKSANRRRMLHFRKEARVTARLAHPSIVPVHALGRLADGRLYYTMKLIKGQELKNRLKAGPDQSLQRTALLHDFVRVCQALAFAHKEGVVHGDLKPSNIMVGEHGEVQVMDWGLAKVLTESDDCSCVGGTAPYMSPEQANGWINEVDRRSDVFGLGAILCEIITGHPPYIGPDPWSQARAAQLADAHQSLRSCGADRRLIDLAIKCLSSVPEARPKDASELEEQLTRYLASVEEELHQTKVAEAEAKARAEQQERMRQLAEEKVEAERRNAETERQARKLAEKAWWRMVWGAASAGLFVVALLAAGFFALRNHDAWRKHLADILDRALTAAMSGDLDAAEQAIAEAERAGASTGQVHMLRGQIALHRGQSRKARQHLEKAAELLSQSVAVRGMLAAAYASDGHWERYDRVMREIEKLTPSTPEDFLFKGYAVAYLEPDRGLETIQQAFERRPMMGIALLLRAEVRAFVAQDTDNLKQAEGAVQDAKYARELLRNNPAAIWVSLEAHLAKAGVHEHREEPTQRSAELKLVGKDADDLKPFAGLPEAIVFRWLYFREMGKEEEVLDELRRASKETDHVSVNFCCALTLYRRGQPGDLEEALRVLERRAGTYNDRLLPFVLAEVDYPNKQYNWPARALKAYDDFAVRTQDSAAVMDTQTVLCLLGKKEDAVRASKALLGQPERFYTLRRDPLLRCLHFNVGDLPADELIRRAGRSRWDQCLAHYSVAMTKLAEGDRKGAQQHFDKLVKTRAFGWGEYDMGWVFQSRFAKDPNWPPWIPVK
jgi:tetratricopeptide (TPR) repeat protein